MGIYTELTVSMIIVTVLNFGAIVYTTLITTANNINKREF